MIIFSFNLYHDVLVHSRILIMYPAVWGFGGALNPFIYVLVYLYFLQVGNKLEKKDLLHLIIPLAYFAYRLYHRLSGDYEIGVLLRYYMERPVQEIDFSFIWTLSILTNVVFAIIYLGLTFRILKRNDLKSLDDGNRTIALFPLVEFIFIVLWYCKILFHFNYDEWILAIVSTIVQILLLGTLIIRYPIQTRNGVIRGLKYRSSKLSATSAKEYMEKIEKVIKEESLYKTPEFSIKDLAKITGINQSYLSQCINGSLHLSFTDYINRFRVDLAKQVLLNPRYNKYTVDAIAEEVGFNSKSSYYRAFKKITNQTPAQYRKQKIVQ